MKPVSQTLCRCAALLLVPCLAAALGQDFAVDWWTQDGGGALESVGGGFALSSTIGQPDVGPPMSGGGFELTGGFWPGIVDSGVPIPGDCGGDRDVDLDDYLVFEGCLAGPGGGLGVGCDCADLDQDGDVTTADFTVFQRCFSGDGIAADPDCAS